MQEDKDEYKNISRRQMRDWIGEANIIYGGLSGLGLVMIQPFMYQCEFVGTAAKVCVFSFAISTPIFAALLLLNHEEDFRARLSKSSVVLLSKGLAQMAAVTGFVAGLWHINPMAGKIAIASCILALVAHAVGYGQLYISRNKR